MSKQAVQLGRLDMDLTGSLLCFLEGLYNLAGCRQIMPGKGKNQCFSNNYWWEWVPL